MDDLISRQTAIDAECEVCQIAPKRERGHNCNYYVHGCKEIECIRALPSAQQWIPVSERLPEARRSVILSTKEWSGEGCYWETTEYHVIWKGYKWNATYWDDEVIAWMPLPEPYKGEES